jgi:hypothetical protein
MTTVISKNGGDKILFDLPLNVSSTTIADSMNMTAYVEERKTFKVLRYLVSRLEFV